MNSSVKDLTKNLGFEVVSWEKLTENVSELRMRKDESEIELKECLFWIDMKSQRCFIKQFVHSNSLIGRRIERDNDLIEICKE